MSEKTQNIEYYENIVKEKTKENTYDIFDVQEENIDIKLNVDAYIPKDYIINDADKIYFYKEINAAKSEEDVFEIADELIDRYSDYGIEVENLLDICLLRIAAEEVLVENIRELAKKITITFKKEVLENLNGKELFTVLSAYPDVRIMVKETLIIDIDKTNNYSIKRVYKLLKEIENTISKN